MKRKVALHNLGCKVNAYEVESMRTILKAGGYEIVPFGSGADIVIINTCTVTNTADQKSRQMLHKAKKMNPEAIVVAVGCYVQARGDELGEDTAVDIIIGNNKKQELLTIIEDYLAKQTKQRVVCDINQTKEYENLSIGESLERTRAYVKVQDGCNQFCSYCIIPLVRGRVRSREMADVLAEVNRLADFGFQEVVLTGIHLSSYGIDREEASGLLELVRQVHQIDKIKRIRLGSLEPRIITEEFVQTIAKLEKVCPHFHLSLQSGCDETLKRMNRRYTTQEYADKCALLRKYYKSPAITTDIIVGFPGESEQDFMSTKEFIKQINFYETHIFKYSPRGGTKAAVMPDQIVEEIKSKRSKELITIGKNAKRQFMNEMLGQKCEVLVEERITINGEEYFVGHTKEYLKVVFKDDGEKIGEMVTVEAREIFKVDYLLGETPCIL